MVVFLLSIYFFIGFVILCLMLYNFFVDIEVNISYTFWQKVEMLILLLWFGFCWPIGIIFIAWRRSVTKKGFQV